MSRSPFDTTPKMAWPPHGDPVSQASLWVPERMYEWQCKILRACMEPGTRVGVVTPNESGKTSVVIPVLGLSWMAAFPGSQVVSTAGVERQVKEQLWPVLKNAIRPYPAWRASDDQLELTAPSVNGVPGSTWKAFTTRDPKYAEGFHPRVFKDESGDAVYAPLLIIIDEAKAFDDEEMIFAFVKRCDPDALLMISTPGEDSGPFWRIMEGSDTSGTRWRTMAITWEDCPHLRRGFKLQTRLDTIKELGKDHPLVQSWVFGKFYRRGGRFVFEDMEAVERARGGLLPIQKGPRYAVMDFSGGGDEQVLLVADGNDPIVWEQYREKDTTRLVDQLVRKLQEFDVRPENIIADNGGLGKPIIDTLESRGYVGMRRYLSLNPAKDKTKYYNRNAEDHFNLRFRLAANGIRLPVGDMKLRDQMRQRIYEMPKDDNRIRMEAKPKHRSRNGSSPDRLDVIVMWNTLLPPLDSAYMLGGVQRTEWDPASRCPSPAMAREMVGGHGGKAGMPWDDDRDG